MTVMTDPIATEYEVRERPDGGLCGRISRVYATPLHGDLLGGGLPTNDQPAANTWRVHVARETARAVRSYDPLGWPDEEHVQHQCDFPFNPDDKDDVRAALDRANAYVHDVIAALRDHATAVNDANAYLRMTISSAENRHGGVVR